MEKIEEVLGKTSYKVSEEYISNSFYRLCKEDSKMLPIRKILLKQEYKNKLTNQVLTYGLVGALESNKGVYASMIIKYMDENDLKIDGKTLSTAILLFGNKNYQNAVEKLISYIEKSNMNLSQLQMVLNYTVKNNLIELTEQLDDKYEIIKQSFAQEMGSTITFASGSHSSWGELKEDGSLEVMGAMGGEVSNEESLVNYYQTHPVLFHLKHRNFDLLDEFFKQGYSINESVIKHAIVKHIYIEDKKALQYLFNQKTCLDIIMNSNEIQTFINKTSADQELNEMKKEVKSILEKIKMDNQLQQTNIANNHPKI